MTFIHEDFLLQTESARRLYHTYAAKQPILDYHSHLSPKDIAENRIFNNLSEIWLEGDHYKWRAMRANGVPEPFCTGNASPFEKFMAWAGTVPYTLRNPLYHWTHLELKRYFDIDRLLDETSAPAIWDRANSLLTSDNELNAHGILRRFRVKALCTTDDPIDDLAHHKEISRSGIDTKVYPTFRPDRALNVHHPGVFNAWIDRLAEVTELDIERLGDFLTALHQRHDHFHAMGCRLSDHGLSHCYAEYPSEKEAADIFSKARAGKMTTHQEQTRFASFMMLYFGHLDAEKGWTKQLHLGARRNNNTRLAGDIGSDAGFDSIGDWPQADALASYLDMLDRENALPRTIVYNLNPADNYVVATMIGNFQDGPNAGKIQLGSGWWFLDQKQGMQWQIDALSNTGLLSRFIGMVTDSRSFMSFPRHEYFRRVLCDILGEDLRRGELPNDEAFIGQMVEKICYGNACQTLNFLPENRNPKL